MYWRELIVLIIIHFKINDVLFRMADSFWIIKHIFFKYE